MTTKQRTQQRARRAVDKEAKECVVRFKHIFHMIDRMEGWTSACEWTAAHCGNLTARVSELERLVRRLERKTP